MVEATVHIQEFKSQNVCQYIAKGSAVQYIVYRGSAVQCTGVQYIKKGFFTVALNARYSTRHSPLDKNQFSYSTASTAYTVYNS